MLQLHKKYKFIFKIGDDTLYYTGTVTSIENGFVGFLDKFGKDISFNINALQSFEEVSNDSH